MIFGQLKRERVSHKARKTGMRYFGNKALNYDTKRMGSVKWEGEDRKVREYLDSLPQKTSILDIPCGTGRFFSFVKGDSGFWR